LKKSKQKTQSKVNKVKKQSKIDKVRVEPKTSGTVAVTHNCYTMKPTPFE